tara:strand:- start:26135 stop:26620 length:486 start_codon:yes stop_codon:yes gene_type:complete
MNNGRIILDENNINNNFFMRDKIPIISNTNYTNTLSSSLERNELSDTFFSQKNINNIQNNLRYGVYLKSNKKYVIDIQSEENIVNIMREYYLEYSNNLNTDINKQVHELNNLVLNNLVNTVYNELIAYLKYKHDIANMHIPIDKPKYSDKTNKTLEYKSWF